jgi:hypothetical protein
MLYRDHLTCSSIRPNLAASLGGLTLYDDLKQHIDQQLADIMQQGGSRKHEIAWNWFEPILREREARNRRERSVRFYWNVEPETTGD